jgi:hypothetical protein
MFTGLDLAGWKADAEQQKHWKMSDGVLRYDGKGAPLWTEKSYGDLELVCDFTATAGVFLRSDSKREIKLDSARKGWSRAVIRLKGDKLSVSVDGKVVTENQQLTGLTAQGSLGLTASGPVQIRNVFVRELKGKD